MFINYSYLIVFIIELNNYNIESVYVLHLTLQYNNHSLNSSEFRFQMVGIRDLDWNILSHDLTNITNADIFKSKLLSP